MLTMLCDTYATLALRSVKRSFHVSKAISIQKELYIPIATEESFSGGRRIPGPLGRW
jgi:hypothetical protein